MRRLPDDSFVTHARFFTFTVSVDSRRLVTASSKYVDRSGIRTCLDQLIKLQTKPRSFFFEREKNPDLSNERKNKTKASNPTSGLLRGPRLHQ